MVLRRRFHPAVPVRLFLERKASVEAQMEELRKTLEVIEHKCLYYKTALELGTEKVHHA